MQEISLCIFLQNLIFLSSCVHPFLRGIWNVFQNPRSKDGRIVGLGPDHDRRGDSRPTLEANDDSWGGGISTWRFRDVRIRFHWGAPSGRSRPPINARQPRRRVTLAWMVLSLVISQSSRLAWAGMPGAAARPEMGTTGCTHLMPPVGCDLESCGRDLTRPPVHRGANTFAPPGPYFKPYARKFLG